MPCLRSSINKLTARNLLPQVFQTLDGNTRLYAMPFTSSPPVTMWQLSFPMDEADATGMARDGMSLLALARARLDGWHDPIGELIAGTEPTDVTG